MARTKGLELLEQLNEGRTQIAAPEFLRKTKDQVSLALEELIEMGARIRPLRHGTSRVGWVRGIHLTERRNLKRWVTDEIEFVQHLTRIGTSLTDAEISDLSLVEMRSLSRVIKAMSDSDLKLYPFVSAFVTTSRSEQLWFSRGTDVTSFHNRAVELPDRKVVTITSPSDQARLWAALNHYRLQAKQRLEASMNAVLTIRPLVGKGADPLANELKNVAKTLQPDILDPWRELIKFKEQPRYDDGWAHGGDDSIDSMKRELMGMMNNDKHEQVFAMLDSQERDRAKKRQEEIEERITARGGAGFMESSFSAMSEEEFRNREETLRKGRPEFKPVEEEPQSSPMDRLAKYR